MGKLTRDQRRDLACGYEKPLSGAAPWYPPFAEKLGYQHKLPTACAGYLTRLPEVTEVARAHLHWTKGQLEAFCGKDEPSPLLLLGIEILEGEMSRVTTYALTDKKDGGGRE